MQSNFRVELWGVGGGCEEITAQLVKILNSVYMCFNFYHKFGLKLEIFQELVESTGDLCVRRNLYQGKHDFQSQ